MSFNDYEDILELAREGDGEDQALFNTRIKEILHYDILHALSQSKFGKNLIFQGGTALRLVYGGARYSEDLDFVCGGGLPREHEEDFKNVLCKAVSKRYGLTVEFKDPKKVDFGTDVDVLRWQAKVLIPTNDPSAKQSHKINIEVCNVPSYEFDAQLIEPKYKGIAPGFNMTLINTASMREIMADKVVALVNRQALKSRDVWDLFWLIGKDVELDMDLVNRKLSDYRGREIFEGNLDARIGILSSDEYKVAFRNEMARFLDKSLRDKMDENPALIKKVIQRTKDFMIKVEKAFNQKGNEPDIEDILGI